MRTQSLPVLALGAVVLGLVVLACGGTPTATGAGATASPTGVEPQTGDVVIEINDSGFVPSEITVASGTKLIVRNTGSVQHSFISDDVSSFNTFLFDPGEEEVIWATVPGTYPFHCESHPNLKGTLTIKE